jgi:hypothetical protein
MVGLELTSLINFERGCAYPGHEYLEQKLVLGETTVKRAVAQLEEFAYFRIERQPIPGTRGRKNVYWPNGLVARFNQFERIW